MNTKFSTKEYENFNNPKNIIPKGNAYGSSNAAQQSKWYDGDITDSVSDSSNPCFFEVDYGFGKVGVIESAKFFVRNLQDKTPFVNNLKFQGSNDGGATWDDLWTVDHNICEGWNYFEWEEEATRPAYNKYRWRGNTGGSCRVTEVEAQGVVAFDDDNDEYTCDVNLIVDGVSTPLNPVTYADDVTPILTDISPSYGSVLGGDTITFTGEGFDAIATTTITISGVECTITSQTAT